MALETAIILNGPPNVGKDTIAWAFAQQYGFQPMAFKQQLYVDTANYFGVRVEELIRYASDRAFKEEIWKKLKLKVPFISTNICLTPREALIYVSENVIKPREGVSYFGDAAVRLCEENQYERVIFSDGGFTDETWPILHAFDRLFIFHLYRDGCTFASDSRGYVNGIGSVHRLDLVDGQPELAVQQIYNTVFAPAEAA